MAVDGRNKALEMLRNTMYTIEVDKSASQRVQRKLEEILPNKWKENTEVRKHFGITDFEGYADGLKKHLGIPEKEYDEILFTHKFTEVGDSSRLEIDFNEGMLDTRYLFFALYKHEGVTDVVYALYTLKAEAKPQTKMVQIDSKVRSFLWGLYRSVEPVYEAQEQQGGLEKFQHDADCKAFLRSRALEGFAEQGVLEKSKLKISGSGEEAS